MGINIIEKMYRNQILAAACACAAVFNVNVYAGTDTVLVGIPDPGTEYEGQGQVAQEPETQTEAAAQGLSPLVAGLDDSRLTPIGEQQMVTTDTSVDWTMVLVNPSHKLPDDFQVDTAVVQYTASEDIVFDARAVDALDSFLSDCVAAGYYPILRASYRSQATQEYLYEAKVQSWQADGYSREDAESIAATIVAIPGTSEHQLGLACDIASTWDTLNSAEADTPVQQWLMSHCTDYGFVLRFPDGKQDLTGIIYEPWHYRYVGVEAAKEMTEKGLCLEEYLAWKGIGN